MSHNLSITQLEKELANVKVNALKEEKNIADANYKILNYYIEDLEGSLPYPDVNIYTPAYDYDSRENIRFQNKCNKSHRDKITFANPYPQQKKLYYAHLVDDGKEYFITDSPLKSFEFKVNKTFNNRDSIYIINADDEAHAKQMKKLLNPNKYNTVSLVRNVTFKDKVVTSVGVRYDIQSDLYTNIGDGFLRKALFRNKNNTGLQSIIETIQEKQEEIRFYKKDSSFIVQGCAGSGKTMVLLHRIKQLLFNENMSNNEYAFLVPGITFKDFVESASTEFSFSKQSIIPYFNYYKDLVSPNKYVIEEDELVFDLDYLAKVYSYKFIQDGYRHIMTDIQSQVEDLINLCETQINRLVDRENEVLNQSILDSKEQTLAYAINSTSTLRKYVDLSLDSYEDIPSFLDEMNTIYLDKKEALSHVEIEVEDIQIKEDDPRLENDIELIELKKEIDVQQAIYNKASFVTKVHHRKKLDTFISNYENELEKVKERLIEEDKIVRRQQAIELQYAFDGITVTEFGTLIQNLQDVYLKSHEIIEQNTKDLEDIQNRLITIYAEEFDTITDFIDNTTNMHEEMKEYVVDLKPGYSYIRKITSSAKNVLDKFKPFVIEEDRKVIDKLKFLTRGTEKQEQQYVYDRLFAYYKRMIKEEYDIRINEVYKHYWYLAAYSQYLTRELDNSKNTYIFMDEAQDLSVCEMDLIHKYNPSAYMNIFGDINQVITKHGIRSWNHVLFVNNKFELQENFRNTNQIVDYCNKQFDFKMEKVGVDMEPVIEYEFIEFCRFNEDSIFVVKDEYTKEDLYTYCQIMGLNKPTVYTVKEAKGLEFKDVYVIDKGMSENERYIAYTRALMNLRVIHNIEEYTDRSQKSIKQGEDIQEEE